MNSNLNERSGIYTIWCDNRNKCLKDSSNTIIVRRRLASYSVAQNVNDTGHNINMQIFELMKNINSTIYQRQIFSRYVILQILHNAKISFYNFLTTSYINLIKKNIFSLQS